MLCYHSVAPDGPPFLSLTPAAFERQLETLKRFGYHGGGLKELSVLAEGGRPHRRLAFLTFDDGYVDNFTHALPLLREHRSVSYTHLTLPTTPYV